VTTRRRFDHPVIDAVSREVTVAGRRRSYTVVVPSVSAEVPVKLLVVLHGSKQNGPRVRAMAARSFDAYAATGQAMVVYPDAYKGLWHDARSTVTSPARTEGVDDVEFVGHLVEQLSTERSVSGVAGIGYSNGGQMVIRIVHEAPGLLTGAGIISATMPTPDTFAAIDRYQPLPVVLIHGTRDRLAPYDGGKASLWGLKSLGTGLSAPATGRYFAERNGITTAPTTTDLPHAPGSRTVATKTAYHQPGQPPVTLYTVAGGGHTIPNPNKNALFILGKTSRELGAAEAIWDDAVVPAL